MFCFHHHLLRSSFLNLFITGCQVHTYATRFVTNYRAHFCRTNFKQFSVLYLGPKIWNSLPLSVSRSIIGSLSSDVFEWRRSTWSGVFAHFGRDFEQILGQIVSLRVRHLTTQMWSRQGILKEKKAHFRLMCIANKRPCLNSLIITIPWIGSSYKDWYWPVEISQLNSISRCLISPCKSLLDCNVLIYIFWLITIFNWIVHGFCSGFFTLTKQ